MITKIMSRCQTSANQAALGEATKLDVSCGAWIPRGNNVILHIVIFNLLILLVPFLCYPGEHAVYLKPHSYILERLKSHDVVFLGTVHKKHAILKFISTCEQASVCQKLNSIIRLIAQNIDPYFRY